MRKLTEYATYDWIIECDDADYTIGIHFQFGCDDDEGMKRELYEECIVEALVGEVAWSPTPITSHTLSDIQQRPLEPKSLHRIERQTLANYFISVSERKNTVLINREIRRCKNDFIHFYLSLNTKSKA